MELTQQEVMAVIGEQALQIAAQRKYIKELEARLRGLGAQQPQEDSP